MASPLHLPDRTLDSGSAKQSNQAKNEHPNPLWPRPPDDIQPVTNMGATKPSDTAETPEPHITRAKILHRPKHPLGPRLALQALRKGIGKTPDEVARLAEMDQEELNRLEQRDDAKLSTIRRYVRALGGELELVVVLKTGHRMRLDI
jgi:hypothetical protein